MIKPVVADKLNYISVTIAKSYYTGDEWYNGFVMQVNNENYDIWHRDDISRWDYCCRPSIYRRTRDIKLPDDAVVESVVDILNKNDSTSGLTILEYLTKMGFNVSKFGWLGNIKRWFTSMKKKVMQWATRPN